MKQSVSTGDSSYVLHGFRYFNETICGYVSCTLATSHYHCLTCGFASNDIENVSNHRNSCAGPNFPTQSSYSRTMDPAMYPSSHGSHHTSSPQGQECSYYSMYSLTQTTGAPTISPGASGFYRTQPAVFSPYYSTNSLGYDGYGQGEPWSSMSRPASLGSREIDRGASCKEGGRGGKVPLPPSSSCLYSQSYSSELFTEPGLDSCYLSRSNQQPSSSRGSLASSSQASSSNQKQLPSFEPSLGFIMGPEDMMYSPAPFSFHVGPESLTEHKASPFTGVEDLPGETCLGLPFLPVPPQQTSCLLETSGGGDQDSEIGSDEHEIIVEETGEEQSVEGKRSCVVCAGACGWTSVELRADHPITAASNTPVWAKLCEVFGQRLGTELVPGRALCNKCLQLLQTMDNLQFQLEMSTQRLVARLHQSRHIEQEDPPQIITEIIPPVEATISQTPHEEPSQVDHHQSHQPELPVLLHDVVDQETIKELCTLKAITPTLEPEKKIRPHLKCELCGRSFRSRRSLTIHMRHHVRRKSQGPSCFMCEVCGRQFSSRSNLSAHKPVCSGSFPLHCNTCGKGFALRKKLQIHEATHRGHFPFQCSTCHKGFLKRSDLSVHERAHSGEKPFVCDICGKRFSNSGNYNHHAKLHNQERPFSCNICSKGFMRRSYLAAHMNRHNGNKPFMCTVCNKAFPDRSNLHHHRKLHEGYKPYTCPVCNKALSSGLQAHIRTHSGERPYSCIVCGQKFTANSSLNKHLKRHEEKSS